jgi:hypothetical protein
MVFFFFLFNFYNSLRCLHIYGDYCLNHVMSSLNSINISKTVILLYADS